MRGSGPRVAKYRQVEAPIRRGGIRMISGFATCQGRLCRFLLIGALMSPLSPASCARASEGPEPPKTIAEGDAVGTTTRPAISTAEPACVDRSQGRWTCQPAEFNSGSARLKGIIFVPDGESAVPGVVILGGSERGPRTRMKERLAEHFAGAGVAALIYDSPGTGQSTGNALLQTREARAEEAVAAARCLRENARIAREQVGVMGISEGALVAMLAAARDESLAFAIPVSGSFGISMTELARYRIEVQGLARSLKLEEIQKALLLEEILFTLMVGPEGTEWRLIDMKAQQWSQEDWTELVSVVKAVRQADSPSEREDQWQRLRRAMQVFRSAPWFDLVVVDVDRFDRFMGLSSSQCYAFIKQGPLAADDFDKVRQELEQLPKVRCPALAVWGEHDNFLPPHRSAAFVKSCLSRAGHKDATFRIVPNASHILTSDGGGDRFADGFPNLLTEWLSPRFSPGRPVER